MASVDADSEASTTGESRRPPLIGILAVAAVVTVLDQLTKWWALEALTEPERTIDLFWTLRLRVIYNFGTAFSLTDNSGPFVSVIAVVVVLVLLRSGRKQTSPAIIVSYGLVVGGTVGNVLDRIFRPGDGFLGGGVVDFVDFQWFPVFNLADSALVVGIVILLLVGLFTDQLDQPTEHGDR